MGRLFAYTQSSVANPATALQGAPLDGISLVVRWNQIEPTQGAFNFSAIDAAGPVAMLRVIPGIYSPAWAMQECGHVALAAGPDNGQGLPCIDIFSPKYLPAFSAALQAVAKHLKSSGTTLFASQITGAGLLGESYLGTDVAAWEKVGWTLAAYTALIEACITAHQQAFGGLCILNVSSGLVGAASGQFAGQVQLAPKHGVGVQQNGLSAITDPARFGVLAVKGQVPYCGAQEVGLFSDPRMGGPGAESLVIAQQMGLDGVELYYEDCITQANWPAMDEFREPHRRVGSVTRRSATQDRRQHPRRVNPAERRADPNDRP